MFWWWNEKIWLFVKFFNSGRSHKMSDYKIHSDWFLHFVWWKSTQCKLLNLFMTLVWQKLKRNLMSLFLFCKRSNFVCCCWFEINCIFSRSFFSQFFIFSLRNFFTLNFLCSRSFFRKSFFKFSLSYFSFSPIFSTLRL